MRFAITLLSLLFAAGCASAPAGQPGATTSPVALRTLGPSPGPSASPSPLPAASPQATPRATQPAPTGGPVIRPPDGMLAAGGVAVAAWLGTYCWESDCVDAPPRADKNALPRLEADGGDLRFRLADGSLFGEWVASYAERPGSDLIEVARGGEFDPDMSGASPAVAEASFAAPRAGDWVVHVQIFAPDGDASYWWHVIVE